MYVKPKATKPAGRSKPSTSRTSTRKVVKSAAPQEVRKFTPVDKRKTLPPAPPARSKNKIEAVDRRVAKSTATRSINPRKK